VNHAPVNTTLLSTESNRPAFGMTGCTTNRSKSHFSVRVNALTPWNVRRVFTHSSGLMRRCEP
jgi:hypothetical protein